MHVFFQYIDPIKFLLFPISVSVFCAFTTLQKEKRKRPKRS